MGRTRKRSHVQGTIGILLCVLALTACGGGGGGDNNNQGGGDTTPPSVPGGLSAVAASASQVNVSWSPSTDDTGVTGYRLFRNGTQVLTQAGTSYQDIGRTASTQYCYQVSAYDAAANESAMSSPVCATTPAGGGDVTAPSTPGNFTATAVSSSQINLAWTASNDNVGVTGYRVYVSGGAFLKEVASTSTSMTGLNPSTQYCYQVSARDAAGNESPKTTGQCATTFAAATPPSPPSGLNATAASSSSINLTWTDNANNETGFKIERSLSAVSGFGQIATVGANVTSYGSGALTASTTYYYRVRAYNATGDSAYSNTANATTLPSAICTPGQTRCVAGEIGNVETCNGGGTAWVKTACPSYKLCSNAACRTVCDITTAPVYPTACMVPNKDNVNNGEWVMWFDTRLAVPTYVQGRSTTNTGGYAPVYSATGTAWPYAWSIDSNDSVGFSFKLNQFTPFRNPVIGFKAKRAGIITGYVNNYFVGLFKGTAAGPVSIGSCGWGPVFYSWSADSCSSGIVGQNFDYSGYWNSMLFSITGDGFGGLIDLLDVNYVYLRVQ